MEDVSCFESLKYHYYYYFCFGRMKWPGRHYVCIVVSFVYRAVFVVAIVALNPPVVD